MDSYETKFYYLFQEIGREFKKKLVLALEELSINLSLRDVQIIEYVGEDYKTMSEIAEKLDLSAGSITPIIDELVGKKVLKRERNEEIDRRKVFISLESKGKTIHKKLIDVHKSGIEAMFEGMRKEDKEIVFSLMEFMLEGIKKY